MRKRSGVGDWMGGVIVVFNLVALGFILWGLWRLLADWPWYVRVPAVLVGGSLAQGAIYFLASIVMGAVALAFTRLFGHRQ